MARVPAGRVEGANHADFDPRGCDCLRDGGGWRASGRDHVATVHRAGACLPDLPRRLALARSLRLGRTGSRTMLYTKLGRIVAVLVLVIGIWKIVGGLVLGLSLVSGGNTPEEIAALLRHFFGRYE